MNAPARTLPAGWGKYIPIVQALKPGATREEAELRARLMLLRDLANEEQLSWSWEAGQVLAAIERIAAAHAQTDMPVETLSATRLALLRFYRAARELEQVFGEHGAG